MIVLRESRYAAPPASKIKELIKGGAPHMNVASYRGKPISVFDPNPLPLGYRFKESINGIRKQLAWKLRRSGKPPRLTGPSPSRK